MSLRNHAAALSWRYGRPIRWALAGLFLLLAVMTWPSHDAADVERPVPVAAHDLASGSRIESGDVTTASTALPLDTPAIDDLTGELVRGPVAAGEPLTRSRLVPGGLVRAPAGTVVFPLTVADERIAELLHSGDRVDVLVAPDALHDAQPRVAAQDVEVLAVPDADAGGVASPQSGAVILLALDADEAQDLAGMRRGDHVTVAIR